MGHKPGREYKKIHKDYMDGKISKEKFLKVVLIEAINMNKNKY